MLPSWLISFGANRQLVYLYIHTYIGGTIWTNIYLRRQNHTGAMYIYDVAIYQNTGSNISNDLWLRFYLTHSKGLARFRKSTPFVMKLLPSKPGGIGR